MRFIHTSDWHLGKNIENESRLEEQALFIDELESIADNENADLIIVAGDIYDNSNPSAEAEKLFYDACTRLSKGGQRPVVIISGNHDSPARLGASKGLLLKTGVVLIDYPMTKVDLFENEFFKITESGEGYFEMELNGEKAVFINMPYPSDKRLNAIISESFTEGEMAKAYSEKICGILENLSKKFREDTINIMTGHFFITGGEESASERNISLGGAYAVNGRNLPANCDYIAMGHLHKPQKCAGFHKAAYYSGSPIQYSKSEIGYAKAVILAEVQAGKDAVAEKRLLKNYKPIEIWRAKGVEQAIKMCKDRGQENIWIYLEIETDKAIEPLETKLMRTAAKDILEISPIFPQKEEELQYNILEEKSVWEDFTDFYTQKEGIAPSKELIDIFMSLVDEMYEEEKN